MRRVGTALSLLALGLITILVCGWFFVHSTAFAWAVHSELDATYPGIVSFERIELDLERRAVRCLNLMISDTSSQPQLQAALVDIELDLSGLFQGAANIGVDHLQVVDFELSLVWDKAGQLRLVEGFRRDSPATEEKRPAKKSSGFTLKRISLVDGALGLAFEKKGFGFRFDEISGAGAIRSAANGLGIDVSSLSSGASAFWSRNISSKWSQRLQQLPDNSVTRTLESDVTRLALTSVAFRDFRWADGGFQTTLSVGVPGDTTLLASGGMAFKPGGPMSHDIALDVAMAPATLKAISGGALGGRLDTKVHFQGAKPNASIVLESLTLESIELEKFQAAMVQVERFSVQEASDSISTKITLGARRVHSEHFGVRDLKAQVSTRVDIPGLTLATLFSSGPSIAGLLSATAEISIPAASASGMRLAASEYGAATLREAKLTAEMPAYTATVKSLQVSEVGHISGEASGKASLGFTGVSLPTTLKIDATKVPASVLKKLSAPDSVTLPEDAFSGTLRLKWDLASRGSAVIESLEGQ